MASRLMNSLKAIRVKHAVGNLNSLVVGTVTNGATAKVDVENYSLVKLSFNETSGDREFEYISDLTDETYLVASSEEMFTVGGVTESYADYYIGAGEKARIVYLKKGLRFEASNFELKSGTLEAKKGMYAEWDLVKKKYVISATKPVSGIILLVVEVAKASVLDGSKCMRFEVQ